jgi:hypothetical protein
MEYQKYFLGVKCGWCSGLAALPLPIVDCLEIWKPEPPGALSASPGPYRDCFNLIILIN